MIDTASGPTGSRTAPRPGGLRWLTERRGGAWSAPLAAASLVTAAAHVPVTAEHLEEAFYIGALFIALEIASVLLLIALVRPNRAVLLAISVVGALAVLAFVVSRSIGLPLIQDDIGNWTEPLAMVSVGAELVMVVGGAVAALGPRGAEGRARGLGIVAGVVILAAGCVLTVVAADAEASGAEMSLGVPSQL